MYQKIRKSVSAHSVNQQKKSQFAPPSFKVQAKPYYPTNKKPGNQSEDLTVQGKEQSVKNTPEVKSGRSFADIPALCPDRQERSSNEELSWVQRVFKAERTQNYTVNPYQAKLTIGQPGDKYEQEADRVAAQVVQQINSPANQSTESQSVQRLTENEEEIQEKSEMTSLQRYMTLQRRGGITVGEASLDLTSAINTARGGGQSLDANLQHSMGQAMGADFSQVRIHTDAKSDQLNESIQAKAFTTGQDVFFRRGAYDAGSRRGQELLAHELTHVVQQSDGTVQRSVIQRLNDAAPTNFRVTATRSNNADCSVTTDLDWDSSVGTKANLADFQSREIISFDQDPKINMPAYNGELPAGMRVAGNILTKPAGIMSNPGGSDKHTGVGHAPKFTVGGIPNLRRAPWELIGTQYYQVKQDDSAIWTNAAGPFIITRTMRQNGDQFFLSISKVGPDCVVGAGPTEIVMETSTAIDAVGAARGDQTADWNATRAQLLNANGNKPALNFNDIATDVRNNTQGVAVTMNYQYTSCDPLHPFAQAYTIPEEWRNTIYQQARSSARGIINNVLTGANPPTQFIITIFRCAGVQQQALSTNENGGTYRVLLRADKLMDMGQWGVDVNTSMAGRESRKAWTDSGRKERFSKAVATHELGHMLHSFSSPNKFNIATLMPANIPQIRNALVPDPLADEKIHICQINGRVINALLAKGYKQKWTYAMNNPGEVVPEVFTAIQHGRNVPKGLAAVYIAYGGIRGGNIDVVLQGIFNGTIPPIDEPEDCIRHM